MESALDYRGLRNHLLESKGFNARYSTPEVSGTASREQRSQKLPATPQSRTQNSVSRQQRPQRPATDCRGRRDQLLFSCGLGGQPTVLYSRGHRERLLCSHGLRVQLVDRGAIKAHCTTEGTEFSYSPVVASQAGFRLQRSKRPTTLQFLPWRSATLQYYPTAEISVTSYSAAGVSKVSYSLSGRQSPASRLQGSQWLDSRDLRDQLSNMRGKLLDNRELRNQLHCGHRGQLLRSGFRDRHMYKCGFRGQRHIQPLRRATYQSTFQRSPIEGIVISTGTHF